MDSYKKPKAPRKFTDEKVKSLLDKFIEYIDKTDIPIVCEFAYKNKINRQRIYELPEMQEALNYLRDKKEAQLERLGLTGKIDRTMAVFSLKQMGWSDTIKQDINVKEQTLKIEYV